MSAARMLAALLAGTLTGCVALPRTMVLLRLETEAPGLAGVVSELDVELLEPGRREAFYAQTLLVPRTSRGALCVVLAPQGLGEGAARTVVARVRAVERDASAARVLRFTAEARLELRGGSRLEARWPLPLACATDTSEACLPGAPGAPCEGYVCRAHEAGGRALTAEARCGAREGSSSGVRCDGVVTPLATRPLEPAQPLRIDDDGCLEPPP